MQKVFCGNNIDLLKESISHYYIVTDDAKVINKKTSRELKFYPDHRGYLKARVFCTLSKHKDKRVPFRLHRLVALFHLKDFDEKLQVNHKDGVKTNNKVDNLEMVTNSINCQHAWDLLDKNKNRRKLLVRNNKGQFIKRKISK